MAKGFSLDNVSFLVGEVAVAEPSVGAALEVGVVATDAAGVAARVGTGALLSTAKQSSISICYWLALLTAKISLYILLPGMTVGASCATASGLLTDVVAAVAGTGVATTSLLSCESLGVRVAGVVAPEVEADVGVEEAGVMEVGVGAGVVTAEDTDANKTQQSKCQIYPDPDLNVLHKVVLPGEGVSGSFSCTFSFEVPPAAKMQSNKIWHHANSIACVITECIEVNRHK